MIVELAKNNIHQIITLLNSLDNDIYCRSYDLYFGATTGKHIRHIIEFYNELIFSNKPIISYDNRKREVEIENSVLLAKTNCEHIIDKLNYIKSIEIDSEIILIQNFSDCTLNIKSTYLRELVFNFEHSLHHCAIIKTVLSNYCKEIVFPDNFGKSESTISFEKNNQKCAL